MTLTFSVYRNITVKARDTERKTEITQIAKALEINQNDNGYQPLRPTLFVNGTIPDDPRTRPYCIYHSTTNPIPASNPVPWTTTCPVAPIGYTVNSFTPTGTTIPTANSLSFTVCASLETLPARVFCISSSQ